MNIPLCTLTLSQHVGPLVRAIFRMPGASASAHDTDAIWWFIFWFDTLWFVFLMGIMIFWTIKYRRRQGHEAPIRSLTHNTPLELVWTIVPSLFLGYMFFKGFEAYAGKLVAPTDAQIVDIVGQQWNWSAIYPNGGAASEKTHVGNTDVPVIHVPVGRATLFRISSNDVIHSFWIPDFRVKFDAIPNHYTSFNITPEAEGEHWIFCAEYCGDFHSEMAAILKVVSEEEYQRILKEADTGGITGAALGKKIVEGAGGCRACHTIDGTRLIGPTWKNAWGYEVPLSDGSTIPADDPAAWDNYIRESIIDPGAKKRVGFATGAQMPSFAGRFSDEELAGIIAYIRSLSDKSTPTTPTTPTTPPPAQGAADTTGGAATDTAPDQPQADQKPPPGSGGN